MILQHASRDRLALSRGTLFVLLFCCCNAERGDEMRPPGERSTGSVTSGAFGSLPGGRRIEAYTLTNPAGVEVQAITYGGIIVSLKVPDRHGELHDVVLGYDDLAGYLTESPYFGAIIGRYGNRIGRGRFVLDGRTYTLATNNGPNHLHGGVKGFNRVVWEAEPFEKTDSVGVIFSYTSPDGEEGYPGNLAVTVAYTLTAENELIFDYHAVTDKATPINLTQHSYFNLASAAGGDILDHELTINADSFTPVDATLIPHGAIAPVEGTPFDFRTPTAIGARIEQDHQQLEHGLGYDHNFVLNRGDVTLVRAAQVYEPETGRQMDVYTTEPGIQFYSGNFLDGSITGKAGHVYDHRYGFCLESQHYPDSPNRPESPSTILRPGEEYHSTTIYAFSVRP